MFLLQNNNSKLGKRIYGFNLPLSTCEIFRTPICRRYCYARHGSYTFPKNRVAFDRNLEYSLRSDFNLMIQVEIDYLGDKIRYIRLHSAGDFYSQAYYEKWNLIARKNPNIRILAFTRNWVIKTQHHAPNFILYYSTDESTVTVNPTISLRTHLISFSAELKQGFKHMQKIENYRLCLSKCEICRACWFGKTSIAFLQRWQARVYSVQGGVSKPALGEFRDKCLGKVKIEK